MGVILTMWVGLIKVGHSGATVQGQCIKTDVEVTRGLKHLLFVDFEIYECLLTDPAMRVNSISGHVVLQER